MNIQQCERVKRIWYVKYLGLQAPYSSLQWNGEYSFAGICLEFGKSTPSSRTYIRNLLIAVMTETYHCVEIFARSKMPIYLITKTKNVNLSANFRIWH